jgi:hypothetical protein
MRASVSGLITAAAAVSLASFAAQAEPESGSWSERTQEMAGGMAIRKIETQACYASGKSSAQAHIDRLAQRLIDPSCTSEGESKLDATRFDLHCGGAAFGDGVATVNDGDDHTLRVDIIFHNHSTGLDMEYLTDSSWSQGQCGGRS